MLAKSDSFRLCRQFPALSGQIWMTHTLNGRSAIVTGGSRGIGHSIVERFLDEGARVIVASRSAPAVTDHRLHWVETDVSKSVQVDRLFEKAKAHFSGKLDILVNNAGVQLAKTIDETTDIEFEWLNATNIKGCFECCRAAVRWMRAQGGGSIVNIGSIATQTADRELAAYSASKAWLQGLTRAIATDHGPHNIRCNAVCPTWTMTEMSIEMFEMEPDPAKAQAGVERRHPLGRLATTDDIANACVWLASDKASFISGQCLTVDGGMSAGSPIDPAIDLR